MGQRIAIEFTSGVSSNSVGSLLKHLNRVLPGDELLLLISSSGGNNIAARAAFSALANLPKSCSLTTVGCGTVDSAAILLYCAGRKRLSLPHTRFLIHSAAWDLNEKVHVLRAKEIYELLVSDNHSTAVVLSESLGMELEAAIRLVNLGVVWTTEKAMQQNLVHEICDSKPSLLDGFEVLRIFNE